jgi:hypothetical protein
MKKIVYGFIIIFLLPPNAKAADRDTTIQGVRTEFNTPVATAFPPEWQQAPINVFAARIEASEIDRCKRIIQLALDKYPGEILTASLNAIYFFKRMSFYNVGFGGTNSIDALYLTNNGKRKGYTDAYLEQTFHHEFSSILLRKYPGWLDTIIWKKANIPGFDYNDPESGVGAIRKNQSSQELDTLLCAKGFLTQYSYSSFENDVNTLAQNLFKPSPGFWTIVYLYPRIQQKVQMLIGFYNRVNPLFTENYFRQFEK